MKWQLPRGLTKRFIFLGLWIFLLPMTLIFTLAIFLSQQTLESQSDRQTFEAAKSLSNQTRQVFNHQIDVLETFVLDYRNDQNLQRLSERAAEHSLREPLFSELAFYDQNGEPDITDELRTNVDAITEKVFEESVWRRSSFVKSKTVENGHVSVFISVPVQEEDHAAIQGALIGKVNSSYLYHLIQSSTIGSEGRNLLVTTDGVVFTDTLGNRFRNEYLQDEAFFSLLDRGKMGSWRGDFLNESQVLGYMPVDRLPFYAITTQPKSQASAPISTLQRVLSSGWMLLFIAGIILLGISAKWIVNPVRKLTDQAMNYAEGESWHLKVLEEKDEIRTLTKAMRYMAEDLQEKERFLQRILESFPYGVISTDSDGLITSVNREGAELFNEKRQNFIGKPIEAIPSKGLSRHVRTLCQKLKPLSKISEEFSFINYEQQKLIIKVSSTPLLNENREIIGVLTTFWNHTEYRKLEQHLQRSEHLAAIGQMTAGLAHEVKNPLGTIQMAGDVIEAEIDEIRHKYQLNTPGVVMIGEASSDIQEESKRLNELVTRFLKMSRPHKGEETSINIGQLIEEVSKLVSHQMKRADIECIVHQQEENLTVVGDRNQLFQAFLNLSLNALEAMKEKENGMLSITVSRVRGSVKISFHDNGTGIPSGKIKRIFNPFFSTKQEGTGLGLAITHDLINEHKGSIEVESEVGKGSEFIVRLPLQKVR
ncbi:PAS domain-containing sensor histidine kinase [Alteribacter populi]|uniref:PAS domain-containing sensor histidine kinase n=1 Tax=Alteribacter populi TaxID=2011011 RepID=UPI000BBA50D6|nr:PAS domain-containing sensor histidine kinase [Alteribacter populi]